MPFFQVLFLWNFSRLWNHIKRNSHYSVRLFVTPCTAAHQTSLSITNSRNLLKLMSIESEMPSNHLIFCCPLLLPPSIFFSITVFSNVLVLCIRWPKYWSFSFNNSPSNEYSGLISFRIDWFDLLAVHHYQILTLTCNPINPNLPNTAVEKGRSS